MAASAAATECRAFEAVAAAYLNGLVAVRGRDRTDGDGVSGRPVVVPAFSWGVGSACEALGTYMNENCDDTNLESLAFPQWQPDDLNFLCCC